MKLANFNLLETKMPKGVQAILNFGDYELSVVKNTVSYGGKDGLFEIAVFKDGKQYEMPGVTQEGDTVKGFLNEDEVDVIIKKMFMVTKKEPTQVM
jgi:hypothetical protein